MRYLIIAALLLSFSAGCSTVPFKKFSYTLVEADEPEVVREHFALLLPQKFQLVNTIVFHYNSRNMSAIGYIAVDRYEKAFTAVALNPVGIKLFEFTGRGDDSKCNFALPEFARRDNFTHTVAEDIRRVYFDLIPDPNAEVYKEKYKIIFRQPEAEGIMEYVFAGADKLLIEKHYYNKKNHRIWSVFYYEYRRENGKIYPAGTILKQYQHKYQLEVRLKEIRL